MTVSSKDHETLSPKLSHGDQRIFEHWQKILCENTLFSPQQTLNKEYKVNDVTSSEICKEMPTPIATTTPERRTNEQHDQQNDDKWTVKQHERCISIIHKLFEKSPLIIFMDSELKKIGCRPQIFCTPCDKPIRGGFSPDYGIAICQNNNLHWKRIESSLTHEMIHAFDHCRFKLDNLNLKHVACTEVILNLSFLTKVRAVALSRECRFLNEVGYHVKARFHGGGDEFGFNRRMQVF